MDRQALRNFYRTLILPEAANPGQYRASHQCAGRTLLAHNPFCGDRFRICLQTDGQQISQMWFSGQGCAISKASISLMIRLLEGKTLAEAQAFCRAFFALAHQPSAEGQMAKWLPFWQLEGREDCGKLGWEALSEAL